MAVTVNLPSIKFFWFFTHPPPHFPKFIPTAWVLAGTRKQYDDGPPGVGVGVRGGKVKNNGRSDPAGRRKTAAQTANVLVCQMGFDDPRRLIHLQGGRGWGLSLDRCRTRKAEQTFKFIHLRIFVYVCVCV